MLILFHKYSLRNIHYKTTVFFVMKWIAKILIILTDQMFIYELRLCFSYNATNNRFSMFVSFKLFCNASHRRAEELYLSRYCTVELM